MGLHAHTQWFPHIHTHIKDPCGTAVHSHGWPPIIHLYYNITHVERTHTRLCTRTVHTHMAKPLVALQTLKAL